LGIFISFGLSQNIREEKRKGKGKIELIEKSILYYRIFEEKLKYRGQGIGIRVVRRRLARRYRSMTGSRIESRMTRGG